MVVIQGLIYWNMLELKGHIVIIQPMILSLHHFMDINLTLITIILYLIHFNTYNIFNTSYFWFV